MFICLNDWRFWRRANDKENKLTISIHPLERPDFDAWYDLWTGYLNYYETSLPQSAKEHAFERLLDPATKVQGLLASQDAKPLGLVHYIFHDHLWRPEGVCYLQDLFTTPEARGHGVGRALIESVYAAADKVGVPRVYWLTQDFNAPARRLYDHVGKLSPFIKYDRP